MSWIANLDARSTRWPFPVRLVYLAVKWYLVIGGGLVLGAMYLQRIGILAQF